MCFGRELGLQSHLEKSMCLSYGLRHEVAPILKEKYGISFANVMFVTEESLDEESFKALSLFWSMKVVPLPEVHPDRITGVCWYSKDDHIRPEHAFLKHYTATMLTEIAVVSDVDVVITNPSSLADALAQFITDERLKQWQEKVGVSAMAPIMSGIKGNTLKWSPEVIKPEVVQPMGFGIDCLSYCFAILSPDESFANPYVASLADNSDYMGKLSDKDFFSYFNRDGYMVIPQNIMAVLWWWTDVDLMERVMEPVIQMSVQHAPQDKIKIYWKTSEFAMRLFGNFGAVHCSSYFELADGLGRNKEDFVNAILANGEKKWEINFTYPWVSKKRTDTIVVRLSDWASTLCWNLNCLSRQKCLLSLMELRWRIEDYKGFKSPEEGMFKAFRTINAAYHAKKNESWNVDDSPYSYGFDKEEYAFATFVFNEDSIPVKAVLLDEEPRKGRKNGRWRQRKHKREQKASSSSSRPVHQCSDDSQNAALKKWIEEFERGGR